MLKKPQFLSQLLEQISPDSPGTVPSCSSSPSSLPRQSLGSLLSTPLLKTQSTHVPAKSQLLPWLCYHLRPHSSVCPHDGSTGLSHQLSGQTCCCLCSSFSLSFPHLHLLPCSHPTGLQGAPNCLAASSPTLPTPSGPQFWPVPWSPGLSPLDSPFPHGHSDLTIIILSLLCLKQQCPPRTPTPAPRAEILLPSNPACLSGLFRATVPSPPTSPTSPNPH